MKSLVVIALLSVIPALAQSGEPIAGKLKTKVDPGRAGVFIDGKYVGTASNFKQAHTFSLNSGEHEVTLVDPRYEEIKTKVTIKAGQTVTLSEKMKALPTPQGPFGRIRILGFDKYSPVYLNGKFYGHADELSNFAQGLLIQPGEYAVRVESTAGATLHEEKVKVEAGKVAVVKAH